MAVAPKKVAAQPARNPQKGMRSMNRNSSLIAAVLLGGTVGLTASTSWSQQAQGKMSQSFPQQSQPGQSQPEQQPWQTQPEQSRPGATEGMPGTQGGTQELSKNDMQAVQQALKDKGYDVSVNGMADESTRAAIRKFQQDEGLPVTGMIDERTANQLGFQVRSQGQSGSSRPGTADQPGSSGSGDHPGIPGLTGQPGSTEQPSQYR